MPRRLTKEAVGNYGRKQGLGRNVEEAAKERIRRIMGEIDRPVVSFSGGKDSTVVLNLSIEVARELGRLPLDVYFADEEAIPPETVEYVDRVSKREDVRLLWSCIPLTHRNACSRTSPYWQCWHPDEKHLWCRPLPAQAVTPEMRPDVPWGDIPEQMVALYGPENGTVGFFLGRRTQESLTRYRMITQVRGGEAGVSRGLEAPHIVKCDPIYDFTTTDVWTIALTKGWDYNHAYDLYTALGIPAHSQRMAPPYGEEPSRSLWAMRQCWPHLWDKMSERVPGANCAMRYSATAIYGYRDKSLIQPAEGEGWEDYVLRLVTAVPDAEKRAEIAGALRSSVDWHAMITNGDPMPEIEPDKRSGFSWQFLAFVVWSGNFKRRTLVQKLYRGFNVDDPRILQKVRDSRVQALRDRSETRFLSVTELEEAIDAGTTDVEA